MPFKGAGHLGSVPSTEDEGSVAFFSLSVLLSREPLRAQEAPCEGPNTSMSRCSPNKKEIEVKAQSKHKSPCNAEVGTRPQNEVLCIVSLANPEDLDPSRGLERDSLFLKDGTPRPPWALDADGTAHMKQSFPIEVPKA